MFTGIVDHCGSVEAVQERAQSRRVRFSTKFEPLTLGESIAVDGVCLTVTDFGAGFFWADVSPETLSLTVARDYEPGRRVNLERPLRVGDRLGGHWVTGHVDQRARVSAKRWAGDYLELAFSGVSPEHGRYLVKKGSVAVNGVSLTVNELRPEGFAVMLIPHTLERTSLASLEVGSEANIELDWMTKIILNDRDERLRNLSCDPERQAPHK